MSELSIFVDESGDFEESEANLNSPSLVGGVFFQKESINEQAAEHIISQVRDKYVKKNSIRLFICYKNIHIYV